MDARVSVNCVAAWLVWFAAFAFVLGDLVDLLPQDFGEVGLCLSAAAATLHIREMLRGLETRERTAFDLGRDSVRSIR